ncbi:MAG: IS66 family transposase [Proteobacteria bacterium]|nr:IS66 family transposase [Pseudomonadota bacterium]
MDTNAPSPIARIKSSGSGPIDLVRLLLMVIGRLSAKLEDQTTFVDRLAFALAGCLSTIELLKKENLELQVRLNKVNRVFAPKNEKSSEEEKDDRKSQNTPKRRGAQPGRKPRSRNIPEKLPKKQVDLDFDEVPRCDICETPYKRLSAFDKISNQIAATISVLHEVATRFSYKKACDCPGSPKIKTAPQRKSVIKKGVLSTATWVHLIIMKYFLAVPIYRYRQLLESTGYGLSAGTVENGFKKIGSLLAPVYQALVEELRKDRLWNADETRWKVFETIENKSSFLWWLWVFASKKVVIYVIDPTRSADVIRKINNGLARIIAADRFSSYEAVKGEFLFIAYCWVHLRRDFISLKSKDIFLDNPAVGKWVDDWLFSIKSLFKLNKKRRKSSSEKEISELTAKMRAIVEKLRLQNVDDLEYKFQKKILKSFLKRYDGYTIFIDHPEVPMHNNRSEQLLKTGINGRKNYLGNVSQKSVFHTQVFLSIIATAKNNKVAPQIWLDDYLSACAENDSKPLEGSALKFHVNKLLNQPS